MHWLVIGYRVWNGDILGFMELIDPSMAYAQTFEEGIAEFQSLHIPAFLNNHEPLTDTAEYIERTRRQAQGIGLGEGWVPSNTYWLMDDGVFIGLVNIRHHLNPILEKRGGHIGYSVRPSKREQGYGTHMLGLALKKAKELGIDRVLITCNTDNIGSRKVIENNGGKLKDIIEVEKEKVMRFWIENDS